MDSADAVSERSVLSPPTKSILKKQSLQRLLDKLGPSTRAPKKVSWHGDVNMDVVKKKNTKKSFFTDIFCKFRAPC